MSAAKLTTDHKTIKQWVKTRDGKPATVKGTGDGQPGVLQIDFPGYSGVEDLKTIQWNAFFKKFDKENLAFLYKEKTDGNVSRFCKLVHAPQGVLQTLHEEHEKVLGLLEDASETTTRALKTRPRLLESLREALLPHMAGEEKVVYKVIKKQAEGEESTVVLEGFEEHRLAKKALKRLEKADPESLDWDARLSVLKELIEHHIEEEESEMFDLARNVMEEDALEELEEPFQENEERALARMA